MGSHKVFNYVIAATPRTGSWLLCEILDVTGVAGHPDEYGQHEDAATWGGHHGFVNHAAYFFAFPQLLSTNNGVFGLKAMWPQWRGLGTDAHHYLRRPDDAYRLLRDLVGPLGFIRLRRDDRLRQAVSFARAEDAQQWSTAQPVHSRPRSPLGYRRDAVARALAVIDKHSRLWDEELARIRAPVLDLSYEGLVADIAGTRRTVLTFLGLDDPGPHQPPTLSRQADATTEQWLRQARDDGLGIG